LPGNASLPLPLRAGRAARLLPPRHLCLRFTGAPEVASVPRE